MTTLLMPSTAVFHDGPGLPHAVGVVAPLALRKALMVSLVGEGGGEVGRVGLGKHRRSIGGGRGRGLRGWRLRGAGRHLLLREGAG